MERGLLRGVAILRVVALALLVGTLITEHADLRLAGLAWVLVVLAGVVTALTSWLNLVHPQALTRGPLVLGELLVGLSLLLLDGVVFKGGHIGSTQSGLAGSWPVAGVLSAGIALGPTVGFVAGAAMGVGHLLAAPLNGVSLGTHDVAAFVAAIVLYAIYGVAAGYAVHLVHAYDDAMARSRAREEVSRTLHDGVLQTLAVIERRSHDPQLALLAREQERALRAFLAGVDHPAEADTRRWRLRRVRTDAGALRASIQQLVASQLHETATRASVFVADDTPTLRTSAADAMLGAVAEALTNVAKHAGATSVTIFVEPAGRGALFCSIKDDGVGFDPAEQPEGFGLTSSIRRRMAEVGGRVELVAHAGGGTEVRLWT